MFFSCVPILHWVEYANIDIPPLCGEIGDISGKRRIHVDRGGNIFPNINSIAKEKTVYEQHQQNE